MWQRIFEKYRSEKFTVVGLALDAEGIAPAKRYYEEHGVTFHALVDPNYATQFRAVPKTFLVNEHGVVQEMKKWENEYADVEFQPVTDDVRAQWSNPDARLNSKNLAALVEANAKQPNNLSIATQLASRYLSLGLHKESQAMLTRAVKPYQPKPVAKAGGREARLLGQAYLQLMRSCQGDRESQVKYATVSYNLSPSIGFAKQIARIIDPTKFDGRPNGRLDNTFREATYQRLRRERAAWLDD